MINDEYLILVKNIKYWRKKRNLSQEKLAEVADLSSSYIKQIEAGKQFKNLTLYSIIKIAEALNIEITELFQKNNTKIGV